MVQEHADLIRAVSADLRSAADKLEGKAIELEDQAHRSRKRRFQRSQSPGDSPSKRKRTKSHAQRIDRKVKNSAASAASARVIRAALKTIHSATNGECLVRPQVEPTEVQDATIMDTVTKITDRFAERLVQENKRHIMPPTKPLSLHQKYVDSDGQLVYDPSNKWDTEIYVDEDWTAVNTRSRKRPKKERKPPLRSLSQWTKQQTTVYCGMSAKQEAFSNLSFCKLQRGSHSIRKDARR